MRHREKIMSEIELNSKRAGLHGFETVKVRLRVFGLDM